MLPHIKSIYVARHGTARRGDGEVLVAEAYAPSPSQATTLRDTVTRAMTDGGSTGPVTVECSIPLVERMIVAPSDPSLECAQSGRRWGGTTHESRVMVRGRGTWPITTWAR
jgi:hypothetical protein